MKSNQITQKLQILFEFPVQQTCVHIAVCKFVRSKLLHYFVLRSDLHKQHTYLILTNVSANHFPNNTKQSSVNQKQNLSISHTPIFDAIRSVHDSAISLPKTP